ncbi:MAG: NAD(P)/FAD-dependent oxidoreductase [Burkholderiales bacterium]|nr:NAD(P)/FAD-dependent oxidoreductase [Anaerolineae bacterium]
MSKNGNTFEVMIIGGGPAGLSAALYLARYNRNTALFDNGRGRSTWHQVNHNYLGFPGGVPARTLRELGYEQLAEYDHVTVLENKIESLRCIELGDGRREFIAMGQAGEWKAQAVILCTGVVDHYPHFDGWDEYVGRSMFWCITCDGYGCIDQCVVVRGNTNETASVALQLSRFTERISVLTDSHDNEISETFQQRLRNANIPLIMDKIDTVEGKNGYFKAITTQGGQRIELDQLFSFQGATPQTKLALDVGIEVNESGYIQTDVEQKTNVAGVYAAGDVTRLFSHQITTAVHEGGQAASAANYYLYPLELKDE